MNLISFTSNDISCEINNVPLQNLKLEELKSKLKNGKIAKMEMNKHLHLFDNEDFEVLNSHLEKLEIELFNYSSKLDSQQSNKLKLASSFALQINERNKTFKEIKNKYFLDENFQDYFDVKQKRLALLAQNMLQEALEE